MLQTKPEQLARPVTSPDRETRRPFSEQVPDRAKDEALCRLAAPDGALMETLGGVVFFWYPADAWVAALPKASVRLAVTLTAPSATPVRSTVADHRPKWQAAWEEAEAPRTPDTTSATWRPSAEQRPESGAAVATDLLK